MTWTAAMPRCRPFKLIDVMIWVATAAAWMALMRPRWDQFQRVWTATRKVPPWQSYLGIAQSGLGLSLWLLTLAYIVMRLIPPRLPRSDLFRQPGMLFLGLSIGLAIVLMFLSAFVPLVAWTNVVIALALGLPWLAACRRYRSRAESGWIEGMGRFVAVAWIVFSAAIYPLSLFRA